MRRLWVSMLVTLSIALSACVNNGGPLHEGKAPNGGMPLHEAATLGQKEIVERLLAQGADVNVKDDNGATPLYLASSGGFKDVVELLLAKGAIVNTVSLVGLTPLHRAADRGYKDIVELLLAKGAKVNAVSFIGLTPLHAAVDHGHKNVVELLLAKGAKVNAKDNGGQTPLHLAASGDSKDIVELLLAKGADVNVKDGLGFTPLYSAAGGGHSEVVELLLAKGADINAKSKWGVTPLHRAAGGGHRKVIEFLLAKGAKFNAKDNEGHTPLDYAKEWGKREAATFLVQHAEKSGTERQKSDHHEVKGIEGESKKEEVGEGKGPTQPPESQKKGETKDKFYRLEGDLKPFEVELGVKAYAEPSILVTLNGAVERRLTLDSGAGVVVIKQDVVRSLNLKRIGEADMSGAGEDIGVHKVDVVLVNTLEIGGLKITQVPADVMLNLPLDGVVGLPVLGRFGLVELDFKKGKLRFTPHERASKGKDPGQGEPQSPFSKTSSGHIIIDAWLNDNPCKAMVDTGAFSTFISRSFLERIGVGVRPPMDPRETLGRIYGFSGSSANWWVIGQRARLRVGDKEMPVVSYRNDRYVRGAALAFDPLPLGVDLILGMPHLKDLILAVDYLNNQMTLRPAD